MIPRIPWLSDELRGGVPPYSKYGILENNHHYGAYTLISSMWVIVTYKYHDLIIKFINRTYTRPIITCRVISGTVSLISENRILRWLNHKCLRLFCLTTQLFIISEMRTRRNIVRETKWNFSVFKKADKKRSLNFTVMTFSDSIILYLVKTSISNHFQKRVLAFFLYLDNRRVNNGFKKV